jgi:hypothetical protein
MTDATSGEGCTILPEHRSSRPVLSAVGVAQTVVVCRVLYKQLRVMK